jgi:HEAT repeat protein
MSKSARWTLVLAVHLLLALALFLVRHRWLKPPNPVPPIRSAPAAGLGVQRRVDKVAEFKHEKAETPAPVATWATLPRMLRFRPTNAMRGPYDMWETNSLNAILGASRPSDAELRAQRLNIVAMDRTIQRLRDESGRAGSFLHDFDPAAHGIPEDERLAYRVRSLILLDTQAPDPQSMARLNALAMGNEDPQVRAAAAVAMAVWKDTRAVSDWVTSISTADEFRDFVSGLTHSVGMTHRHMSNPIGVRAARFDPALVDVVLQRLSLDETLLSPAERVEFLGGVTESPRAVEYLAGRLTPEVESAHAFHVMLALSSVVHQPPVRDAVIRKALDPAFQYGAYSLTQFKHHLQDRETVSALLPLLLRPQWPYVLYTLEALATAEPVFADLIAESVRPLLSHPEERVRTQAQETLKQLGR